MPFKVQILVFLSFLASCGPVKTTAIEQVSSPQETPQVDKDQIFFVFLKITRNTSFEGGMEVQLVRTQKSEGKLKAKMSQSQTQAAVKGELVCTFRDKDGNVLHRVLSKSPLNELTEHPNDAGTAMEWSQVEKKEAELVLRVPYQVGMRTVTVASMNDIENEFPIAKFDL
jgi:hypothetical protein